LVKEQYTETASKRFIANSGSAARAATFGRLTRIVEQRDRQGIQMRSTTVSAETPGTSRKTAAWKKCSGGAISSFSCPRSRGPKIVGGVLAQAVEGTG